MKPYCSRRIRGYIQLSGARARRILLPSRGGMGMRLNVPKTKFITAASSKIGAETKFTACNKMPYFKISAQTIAKIKLLKGPARLTIIIPKRLGLKESKSTGTGLAAPKITGELEINKISGSKME